MNTQFFFSKVCNSFIAIIFLLCSLSMLSNQDVKIVPLTAHQEAIIRKNIYWMCENSKNISPNQLMEDGLTLQEVIDRDINILNNHIDALESKIERIKGFIVRYLIPAKNTAGYWVSAISTGVANYFSVSGIAHLYDILARKDEAVKKHYRFLYQIFCGHKNL